MPTRNPSALGLTLMWVREKCGWTKAQLADALGYRDDSLINRYETCQKPLSR
jgi:DNA-binding XRE family transcriptional regulator